jgi:hypothetical protein
MAMMTKDEMARLRRQMHRRIRVVLAQRRVDTLAVRTPRQRDEEPDGPSGEPAPED